MADILSHGGVSREATDSLPTTGARSINDGVFDGDDLDYGNVTAGAAIEWEVLYHDTGDDTTALWIIAMETADGTADGLPLVPDGGPVTTTFQNTGANRIFRFVPH